MAKSIRIELKKDKNNYSYTIFDDDGEKVRKSGSVPTTQENLLEQLTGDAIVSAIKLTPEIETLHIKNFSCPPLYIKKAIERYQKHYEDRKIKIILE